MPGHTIKNLKVYRDDTNLGSDQCVPRAWKQNGNLGKRHLGRDHGFSVLSRTSVANRVMKARRRGEPFLLQKKRPVAQCRVRLLLFSKVPEKKKRNVVDTIDDELKAMRLLRAPSLSQRRKQAYFFLLLLPLLWAQSLLLTTTQYTRTHTHTARLRYKIPRGSLSLYTFSLLLSFFFTNHSNAKGGKKMLPPRKCFRISKETKT